jgi:hypothetical protein
MAICEVPGCHSQGEPKTASLRFRAWKLKSVSKRHQAGPHDGAVFIEKMIQLDQFPVSHLFGKLFPPLCSRLWTQAVPLGAAATPATRKACARSPAGQASSGDPPWGQGWKAIPMQMQAGHAWSRAVL